MKGSIRDMGKLNDGYCIKIFTIVPNKKFKISNLKLIPEQGKNVNWIFCLDKEESKDCLLTLLIKIKLENQHSKGIVVDYSKSPHEFKNRELKNMILLKNNSLDLNYYDNFKIKDILKKDHKVNNKTNFNLIGLDFIDGYWVVMKDWSECTLKCDGGEQYQYLLCIPPKNNGKPCIGQSVKVRPCNLQPCPKEISQDIFFANLTGEFMDLGNLFSHDNNNKKESFIFKYLPISSRPLHYDKCHLKESDALWLSDEFNNDYYSNSPKVPVRLIMNKNAVSIYVDQVCKNYIKSKSQLFILIDFKN